MIKKETGKIIVAYIPVLHEGYRKLFEKHRDASTLYILGSDITKEYIPLTKDIRALEPKLICLSIASWALFNKVEVLDMADLKEISSSGQTIVMPDEDVMHGIKDKYFSKDNVVFDTIFLRWDKHKSTEGKPIEADQMISTKSNDKKIISLLREEANKSPDWWRQVGAAIVINDKLISMRYNHAVPDPWMPYVEGDPRCDFHKGINIELSTVLHAEAGLIAEAAQKGISLEGASLYVTTFPCPPCAKLIAYSGIKELYYSGGYGVLDGERVLKSKGVKIVFVDSGKDK